MVNICHEKYNPVCKILSTKWARCGGQNTLNSAEYVKFNPIGIHVVRNINISFYSFLCGYELLSACVSPFVCKLYTTNRLGVCVQHIPCVDELNFAVPPFLCTFLNIPVSFFFLFSLFFPSLTKYFYL